jgi:O-antigen ligase
VLEILLKGGIVGFSLFCAMWLANFKSMMKHKKNIITTSICVMILISWLVCTLEYRITIYSMWFLVILTYHINDIIAINNSEHTEYIVNLRSNQNGTDS